MTNIGFQAVVILFVLLPGFLSARIFQSLAVRPQQTESDKLIDALLFSFVLYVVYFIIFGGSVPVSLESSNTVSGVVWTVHLQPSRVLVLAAASVVAGIAMGFLQANDITGQLFRRLKLTQRTTRASIWNDVFHELQGVVQVELGDGRQVMGWLRYYSDDPEHPSLFLEKAAWVTDDGLTTIDGPGIMISAQTGIKNIMFLNAGKK
jgi:uncharacterized protein DUF6338